MKKILNKLLISMCVLAFMPGCKKIEQTVVPYSQYGVDANSRLLKIIYGSSYAANPGVILKINSVVVSGLITGRTPFPGGGYNTTGSNYPLYLTVPQGNDTISVSIPKAGTSIDSVLLYSTVITIPDNAPRTLLIADTLANVTNNKTASVLVKNEISRVPALQSRYRFVNMIPNVPVANGAVDVYVNKVKILANIAYKQASDTFSLGIGRYAPGVTDTANVPIPLWEVRPAGSAVTTNALAFYQNANTMINQRVFTVFSSGYAAVTTGTRIPYLSFTLDKNTLD